MTFGKSSKANDTRDQLRKLMSQHTAATVSRPVPAIAAQQPISPPRPAILQNEFAAPAKPAVAPSVEPKPQASGERCTVRLSASELTKIDRIILETHQRAGERITISDVLRIGLLRLTHEMPVSASEISSLRATDSRRKHNK